MIILKQQDIVAGDPYIWVNPDHIVWIEKYKTGSLISLTTTRFFVTDKPETVAKLCNERKF